MPAQSGLSFLGMSAMESAAEGITIAHISEPDQPLVFVNKGFERMTGHRAEDVIGTNCRFLQGPETDRDVVAQIKNAISSKQTITVEFLNYSKLRKPFWNRLTLAPIAEAASAPTDYYVGVQCDITEQKLLQRKSELYASRLEEINTRAEDGMRTITEKGLTQLSNNLHALHQLEHEIKKHSDLPIDKTQAIIDQIGNTTRELNSTLSGLKVILQNCGGINAFADIDPVTLEPIDRRKAAS